MAINFLKFPMFLSPLFIFLISITVKIDSSIIFAHGFFFKCFLQIFHTFSWHYVIYYTTPSVFLAMQFVIVRIFLIQWVKAIPAAFRYGF
ncbi:hypothetical protein A4V01_04990 [Erysipelotrichaceae bacterium I46]|nr:hypothetical protein A4V01_04990 [Erysipelotrichaceae bacterium I46]ASU19232.1 hypothetical protein ADH65_12335 [[Clostridium] innocuum]